MGYSLGGINWDETLIGEISNILFECDVLTICAIIKGIWLGGHVRAVFTLVTVIFIVCVSATVTSFREIPLWKLEATNAAHQQYTNINGEQQSDEAGKPATSYGAVNQCETKIQDIPMVNSINDIFKY